MLYDASGPSWRQTCFSPLHGRRRGQVGAGTDLAIEVLGRFQSLGGFDYRQRPPQVVLHLVHAGDGIVTMGGQSSRVGAGSAFCFSPGQAVHYHDRPRHAWQYSWMVLGGTRAVELSERLGGARGPWCRDDLPIRKVTGLLAEIEAAYRSEAHSPFYPQAAAWRLLDALSPPVVAGDRSAQVAAALRHIIDEQFAEPLKLATIAKRLGQHRSTLFRSFRELYGSSPKQYLDHLRFEHAVSLLKDGALDMATVAKQCGFASAHRFSKAFAGRFGVAPSRFRE